MHLCTFAVGKGEMLPVFFSRKFGLHPLAPPAPRTSPARLPPAPDAPHSLYLHICARHLRAFIHLAKVRLLDFLRLSVYTYVNVCTSDKSEAPRLPLFACLQIWQAFTHLARLASLDFPHSLFYTYGSAAKSGKNESPQLPHSFCLHICARRYI
jgi:hypothetical protein